MITHSSAGISLQSFIPVRKDPFERSEMVTQILFGENVQILDKEGKWLYIKIDFDSYEGWIDKKCLTYPVESTSTEAEYIAIKNTQVTNIKEQVAFTLPIGSVIPVIVDNSFTINNIEYYVHNTDSFIKPGGKELKGLISNTIGVPYIWGGRSGFGFDCSGLSQFVYRAIGKYIPRDSGDQAALGKTVSFSEQARTGDLAFFDDTEGLIHHVGIIIEGKNIIHASGRVRRDKFDHQGIFNSDTGEYSHKLRVIKRL